MTTRKQAPEGTPADVEDLLLPEGTNTQKFIENIDKEQERSIRAMGSTHHVREAMKELSAVRDAPIQVRAKAPISDRRDARSFPAPVGGHDTLVDAPKVRLSPFGRDEPTVLTKRTRRRRRTWIPIVVGSVLFGLGALLLYAMARPVRVGTLHRTPATLLIRTPVVSAPLPLPDASVVPTATQTPSATTSAGKPPASTSSKWPSVND